MKEKPLNIIGMIATYPGRSNMWNSVWHMEAGIIVKETEKEIRTKSIFGSIERVSKAHIFKIHDIKDKEKVIAVCQRTKDIRNELVESIRHKQQSTLSIIEEIANGYEI